MAARFAGRSRIKDRHGTFWTLQIVMACARPPTALGCEHGLQARCRATPSIRYSTRFMWVHPCLQHGGNLFHPVHNAIRDVFTHPDLPMQPCRPEMCLWSSRKFTESVPLPLWRPIASRCWPGHRCQHGSAPPPHFPAPALSSPCGRLHSHGSPQRWKGAWGCAC